uniref:Uncharacterized protein n=1 Tax=Nicotiana tabacum TaxID=4097 RepID=A0A1S4BIZ7_TOBAC|nr:PREDICTED: uncharacterized protein LOC107808756 [Nicotiana tabacum]
MTDNGVNYTHNLEAQGNQPQHEDSISVTRSKGNEATPVHGRRYPRHVREATPNNAEEESLKRIAQGESELLREFVTQFQKERILLPAIPDEWASEAFTKALVKGREKNKEKSKDDFDTDRRSSRSRVLPYERADGCGTSFQYAYRFVTDRRIDRGRNNRSLQDKETSGSRDPSYPRLSEYNFNVSMVQLVSAMKNIKEARFLKSMRSDPSQRDPNLWCEYHGMNSHRTGDCRHPHEEVAILLKNGHLREFLSDRAKNNHSRNHDNMDPSKAGEDPPRLTINMIFKGNEINRVTFSAAKKDEVDLGCSANIIQWRVLEQSKLTGSIIQATKLLAGFNIPSVTTRGKIMLSTDAEGVMKTTLFQVVDGDMGYNIILGIPWLHEMKVVLSTYHQLLKFPTPEGIKQIKGDQPVAREMNVISVSSSKEKEHAA